MLRHAIAPTRRYTKASHLVIRHQRLNSDAKLLIIHVDGLPEDADDKPLSAHAADLGMTPREYQKAKRSLAAAGYYFEWKWQGERGRWITEQMLSNVPLTREEANAVRGDKSPSAGGPTVGAPESRKVGGSKPVEEHREKTFPHPPPKEPAADIEPGREEADPTPSPEPDPAPSPSPNPDSGNPDPAPEPVPASPPEVVEAERVLLSLRHVNPSLWLGVREARGLAEAAAEWFRRGVSAADMRRALSSGLPREGVRSAVGFLRHRLASKLPAPPAPPATSTAAACAPAAPAGLVLCDGPGDDHVFRPVADETRCRPCRTHDATRQQQPPDRPPRASWRTLVAEEVAAGRV
jgi:hypothetical protein